MNNRENFDMDIDPNQNKRNERNGGSKNKNTILVLFVAILLMVASILVYFVFLQPKNKIEKNTIIVEKTVENIEPTVPENIDKSTELSTNSDVLSTSNFENASVKPVVSPVKESLVAKDLSNAKNAKILEDAVQFQNHIVMDGENLQSIASLYGLNVQTIISVNSIKNIAGVTTGISLSLPDRNGQFYIVKKGDMLSTIVNEYSPTLGWKTLQELNGLSNTKLDVGDKIFIPDMSEVALHPTMSKAVTKFIIPINAKVVARYGQGIEDNIYDDGINIDGILLSGAGDVQASSDGKVLDIGVDNNTSFLIIAHKESYESVYKNIKNIDVEIGEEVKAGDKIGEVDVVGEKQQPLLYFAIRQSGIPLDPESFF
jgi:murein DD-endopeptidase MepM/ murein hydrolase activator NlpD